MNQKPAKKIFIIDDSVDYVELLEKVLTKAGYTIKTFTNPTNVLDEIRSEKPDLVILDIMLPHISGLSILEELKKDGVTKDIAIFCLTNLPEEVGREKALVLGAYCYLTKAHYNIYDIVKHVDFYFKEALHEQ